MMPVITQADNQSRKIIVKFKAGSEILQKWYSNGRKGEIEEFKNLLGTHRTKPFVETGVKTPPGPLSRVGDEKKKGENTPPYSLSKGGENTPPLSRSGEGTPPFDKLRTESGPLTIGGNNLKKEYENLSRICEIEYEADILAEIAARKLKYYPGIEYAEPATKHKILNTPNDPRIMDQYYLNKVRAFAAWDSINTADTIVVGIVDTGVDFTHVDLKENIWLNPGETGNDKDGNDKSSNGIDDDGNGYVDDWHGWDFSSSTSSTGQDNDPKPGHKHGTHLAGTVGAVINNGIGIAGVAKNVKLLPVKIAGDNSFNTSVENGFQGILYAAQMGAKVINCSWGSTTKSQAEQEVINTVIKLGSAVVAAAGNEQRYETFYPAGYKGVMSVAAVDDQDRRGWFSNYDVTVDVSAPGVEIYSTVPGDFYEHMDGTSMASPVAAGVAALVRLRYPELKPLQVVEYIKAGTDNIDSINPSFKNTLGTGRVNALKCMNLVNPKSVILSDYTIKDSNDDLAYDVGEKVNISLNLINVLSPVKNISVKTAVISKYSVFFLKDTAKAGDFETLEEKSADSAISFIVEAGTPENYYLQLELKIYEDSTLINREYISMVLNPSFRTMNANNLAVTFNNTGNIGYNDYPDNLQGDGFKYKDGRNILFEGALMVGVSPKKVSNVARNSRGTEKDRSFKPSDVFILQKPGEIASLEGYTYFHDSNSENDAGVSVSHKAFQFNREPYKDLIFTVYTIKNQSGYDFDSLFTGLYFDWDIGPSGAEDITIFDAENGFGYTKNTKDLNLPWVGVKLLSAQGLNFFAVDNNGTGGNNPGVYYGYTSEEKWQTMTSGIGRRQSGITDASMVIAGGPVRLNNGESVKIGFCIFAGMDYESLVFAAKEAENADKLYHISGNTYQNQTNEYLYPNPVIDNVHEIFFPLPLHKNEFLQIEIFNEIGQNKPFKDENGNIYLVEEKYVTETQNQPVSINISELGSGFYILSVRSSVETVRYRFVVIR